MFAGVVRFAARGWIGALYLEPRYFFNRATAFAFSYAGLCFDLFVVFALCYRRSARSRPAAYAAVVAFHLLTWALFNLGLFPWVMIVCTVGVLRTLVAATLAGKAGDRAPGPGQERGSRADPVVVDRRSRGALSDHGRTEARSSVADRAQRRAPHSEQRLMACPVRRVLQ